MKLLETCLADPYWLFRRWREGVLRRTLGAEDVSAMSAVVLDIERGGRRLETVKNMRPAADKRQFTLTFLTEREKPFPQAMQFCTS